MDWQHINRITCPEWGTLQKNEEKPWKTSVIKPEDGLAEFRAGFVNFRKGYI